MLAYLASSVDCIHTSLPVGRLRLASAAPTSGPKPRAVIVKFLEYVVDVDGDRRSIMHSGGRENVVVMPLRLTDEEGSTRIVLAVPVLVSQLAVIMEAGVVVTAVWKWIDEIVAVVALGGDTTLKANVLVLAESASITPCSQYLSAASAAWLAIWVWRALALMLSLDVALRTVTAVSREMMTSMMRAMMSTTPRCVRAGFLGREGRMMSFAVMVATCF